MVPSLPRFARIPQILAAVVLASLALTNLAAATGPTPVYKWTTIAGRASTGDNDGPAADARFNRPTGLTADVAGNVYVADTGNHTIRKISPTGLVSTFAGTAGQPGNVDGVGSAARFHSPRQLAADASGNIYVSDLGANGDYLVRKISPAGAVTTIKLPDGRNLGGFACADPVGNLYFWENNILFKLTNGLLQTIQVPATATDSAGYSVPVNVNGGPAVDAAGQLYFTLPSTLYRYGPTGGGMYASVVKLDPSGNLSLVPNTSTGTYGHGIFNNAAGNIYHTLNDSGWGGTPGYYFGGSLDAPEGGVSFVNSLGSYTSPTGMAVGPAGRWYYTRYEDDAIINGDATTFAGTPRSTKPVDGPAQSSRCAWVTFVAVDASKNVWFTESLSELYIGAGDYITTSGPSLRQVAPAGIVTTVMSPNFSRYTDNGYSRYAIGLAPDGNGGVYLPQFYNAPLYTTKELHQVSPAGTDRTLGYLPEDGIFFRMNSVGRALLLSRPGVLRRQSPDGTWEIIASSSNVPEIKDGTKEVAQFSSITTFATDGLGNCLVFDQLPAVAGDDNRSFYIRRIAPDGAVKTIGPRHTVNWSKLPITLGADSQGRIFIGYSDRVTLLDDQGSEFIIGGKLDTPGSTDGNGELARFNSVTYLTTDAQDNIFAVDSNHQTVRKGVYLGIAPAITTQPLSQAVPAGGTAQFVVTAGSTPAPSYQWYIGTHAIAGATGNSFTLSNVRSTDAGDYMVVVTNELGSATSDKATLTVTTAPAPAPPTPPAQSSGSGGGGGGAPSLWFVMLLGLLGAARFFRQRA